MRTSLIELIERASDVKVLLGAGKFTLSDYDDGAYVDFEIDRVYQTKELHEMIGNLEYKLFGGNSNNLVIRICEDFKDY